MRDEKLVPLNTLKVGDLFLWHWYKDNTLYVVDKIRDKNPNEEEPFRNYRYYCRYLGSHYYKNGAVWISDTEQVIPIDVAALRRELADTQQVLHDALEEKYGDLDSNSLKETLFLCLVDIWSGPGVFMENSGMVSLHDLANKLSKRLAVNLPNVYRKGYEDGLKEAAQQADRGTWGAIDL